MVLDVTTKKSLPGPPNLGVHTIEFRACNPAQRALALPNAIAGLNLAKFTSNNPPVPLLPGADQELPCQEPGTRKNVSSPERHA